MKRVEAPCPGCGAPVEFRVSSSLVVVCEHCGSVVARGDRQLEDLGKTAALVETLSPLELGQTGRFEGKSFELVGHTQFQHASGALWDEWYALLSNDQWIWIAEAQGKFYVTRKKKLAESSQPPNWDELQVGQSFSIGDKSRWTVAEKGTSAMVAAAGELPFRPVPGQPHRYVDFAGPDGGFGTLDFDDTPLAMYVGRAVTLADIGMAPAIVGDDERSTKTVAAVQVACPQCGGSLDLHAPDRIERVVCPFCRAVLDAEQGSLKYLQTLKATKVKPLIPIGRTGEFRGKNYTVIGFLQRSVTIDERDYFWTEYLLYQAEDGFRWLVDSDGHWSFVEPISPGDVEVAGGSPMASGAKSLRHGGRSYRLFQRCPAKVRFVLGEFFWKVYQGETVLVADYVSAPYIVSSEFTPTDQQQLAKGNLSADEINYSRGIYVPHTEIEKAFGIERLPRGWGVAPHQVNPIGWNVYGLALLFSLLLMGLNLLISVIRPPGTVDSGLFCCAWPVLLAFPFAAWMYSQSFERSRWEQSYIEE